MKFKIIPNEQTPAVIYPETAEGLIRENFLLYCKFLPFARRQHNCVGLAANQVRVDGARIMAPFFAIQETHFWDIVIYPKIEKYEGAPEIKTEACLTWLGKKLQAPRWPVIQVSYYKLNGQRVRERVAGFKAQIWQHEYDHLTGVKENIID